MSLDAKQALAISSDKLILTGGPGTGKTHCMMKKLDILINEKKIAPEKILILYSDNAALSQLKHKITQDFGQEISENTEATGILDFCSSLCGENFFQIFKDQKPAWSFQKQTSKVETILMEIFPDGCDPQQASDLVQSIDKIRQKDFVNQDLMASVYEKFKKLFDLKKEKKIYRHPVDIDFEKFNTIFYRYCDEITENNRDQNEVISLVLKNINIKKNINLIKESWSFLMVAEFQSVNEIQGNLINKLVEIFQNNIWMIGDDQQCVSGYSGSKSNTIQEFTEQHSSFLNIQLISNYRSSKKIIDTCQKMFPNNQMLAYPNTIEGIVEYKKFKSAHDEQLFIAKKIVELDKSGSSNIAILNRRNTEAAKYMIEVYGLLKNISPPEQHQDLKIFGVLEPIKHMPKLKIIIFLLFVWSWDIDATEVDEFPYKYYHIWSQHEQTNPFSNKEFDAINQHWKQQGKVDLMYLYKLSTDKQKAGIEFCDLIQNIKSIQITEENSSLSVFELTKLLWDIADLKDHQSSIFDNLPKHKKNYLAQTVKEEMKHIKLDPNNRRHLFESAKTFLGKIYKINLSKKQLYKSKNRILSLNLHSVSGMEFDHVFICGLVEKNIPTFYAVEMNDERGIMEEKKLLYSAISTAKKSLFLLSSPRGKCGEDSKPTRFLAEMLC